MFQDLQSLSVFLIIPAYSFDNTVIIEFTKSNRFIMVLLLNKVY
jgi:hypothetical protein